VIDFGDGSPTQSFNHPPPASVTHTFTQSSCGETFGSNANAFGVTLVATNPCGNSEATVAPIRISTPPTAGFTANPETICVNQVLTMTSTADPGTTATSSSCNSTAIMYWSIAPSAGWTASGLGSSNNLGVTDFDLWTGGSATLPVTFNQAGVYTVTQNIANGCGGDDEQRTICVIPPPTCAFTLTPTSGCSVLNVSSNNTSTPPSCNGVPLALQYTWTVSPPSGGTGSSTISSPTAQNPTFTFTNTGSTNIIFTVTLNVAPIDPLTGLPITCTTTCTQTVTVYPAPVIFIVTPTQSICVGGTPDLLSVAYQNGTGTPTYQWYSNTNPTIISGNVIPGANQSTYVPPVSEVGTTYYFCQIYFPENSCGGVISNVAEVQVVAEPLILEQPTPSQVICQNSVPQALAVSVAGAAGNYIYQWYVNSNLSPTGGTAIANATSSVFLPPSFDIGTYYYYCVVSTSALGCSETSSIAQVIVSSGPTITSQPTSDVVCLGGVPEPLCVSYNNGTQASAYQWYSNTSNSAFGGTPILGAYSSCYLPTTNTVSTTYYYVEILFLDAGCSSVFSQIANVVVNPSIEFASQPTSNQTICAGGSSAELTVEVASGTGVGIFDYQWYSNTTATTTGGSLISGATQASYTPPVFNSTGNFYYYCVVTDAGNGCGTVTSALATVTVVNDPTVTSQPLNTQTLCQTAPATALTVVASGGTGTLLYQWYSNTSNSNTGGTLINGANSASYSPPTVNTGATYYYCLITTAPSGCSVASAAGAVIVSPAPTFTDQPTGGTVCVGGSPTQMCVTYSNGSGTPAFQWYSNTTNTTTGGTPIAGATSNCYIPMATTLGTTYYYAELILFGGGCSAITSNTAAVFVESCNNTVFGCMDTQACNYNSLATESDNSCIYPEAIYLDCNGNCINDLDSDGICDEIEVSGCTNPEACNYNALATEDDGSCEVLVAAAIIGNITPDAFTVEDYSYTSSVAGSTLQWTITNGVIISGQGTESVQVQWAGEGMGTIQVQEVVDADCIGPLTELNVVVLPVQGVLEYSNSGIMVYPNPAIDEFRVKGGSSMTGCGWKLMDITGRAVQQGIFESAEGIVSLSNCVTGPYVLQVTSKDEIFEVQVIKLNDH
jgi:hypothetical protein